MIRGVKYYAYITLTILAMLTTGCGARNQGEERSSQSLSEAPFIVISIGKNWIPQVTCSGKGVVYEYQSSFSRFSIIVRTPNGDMLINLKGAMRLRADKDNRVAIALQSSSKIAYQIRLLGFSPKDVEQLPEEQAVENLMIPAGEVSTNFFRYVYYVYDLIQ